MPARKAFLSEFPICGALCGKKLVHFHCHLGAMHCPSTVFNRRVTWSRVVLQSLARSHTPKGQRSRRARTDRRSREGWRAQLARIFFHRNPFASGKRVAKSG